MATIAIRLDPQFLDNPDADIRYRLPDLLAERSASSATTGTTTSGRSR